MDFSQSSTPVSAGLSAGNLGFGERSVSSITTEFGEARRRIAGQPMSPGLSAILSPSNPSKQYRSTSDIDVDSRDDALGPLKLARTESYNHQLDLKMQMTNSGTFGSLGRSNSIMSDGRLGSFPANFSISDGGLLANEANFMSETRLMRNDTIFSCPQVSPGGTPRVIPFQHQAYSFRPSGLPLVPTGNVMSHTHENDRGSHVPFTINQLRELQHQALIFKYIRSGHSVPAEILMPIRNGFLGLSGMATGAHQLTNFGWGNYHLAFANNTDPEPGRCRRTDGKKWRCSRDVVPEQKYCERHMHRGRHRTRKTAENNQTNASQAASVGTFSASTTSSVSLAATRGTTLPSNLHSSITLSTGKNGPPSSLGLRNYSGANSPTGVGRISAGSSVNASNFHLPLQSANGALQSASGANILFSKDYRYLNGATRTDILNSGQMFFSRESGGARGFINETQPMNGLPMFSSVNDALQSSVPSFKEHQQHSFQRSEFGSAMEAVNANQEQEGQPLRHFFDDWPRSRDSATLSWLEGNDDRSNHNSSTTHLSISIPMASSDFNIKTTSSPRGKLSLSSLKLSMSRIGDDDPLGVDATQMGLGVSMGAGMSEDRDRQTNWNPITWETSVGGPLGEVLKSRTCTTRGFKSSGLNLMTDGWENSPRDNPRLASPADEGGAARLAGSGMGALETSKSID